FQCSKDFWCTYFTSSSGSEERVEISLKPRDDFALIGRPVRLETISLPFVYKFFESQRGVESFRADQKALFHSIGIGALLSIERKFLRHPARCFCEVVTGPTGRHICSLRKPRRH